MLSRWRHYQQWLKQALVRHFPRTSAYLRANAALPAPTLASAAGRKKAAPGRTKKSAPAGARRAQKAPTAVYAARFKITAKMDQAMREQVALAVAAGVVREPSPAQWQMILGRRPLTRIFAGAGSGKSSTLVLRVVFMLAHMQIAPQHMTVISFTNASCAELREQLCKLLPFWQLTLSTEQLQQLVRTFHAAMLPQARSRFGQVRWFEQLDQSTAQAPDNPLAAGRLRAPQLQLLEAAYQRCYAQEPGFRQALHSLLGSTEPVPLEAAPKARYRLAGEMQALPIYEALHTQLVFSQSLGLSAEAVTQLAVPAGSAEQHFAQALACYWRTFESLLAEQGLMSFDQAFQALAQQPAAIEALDTMRHVLIDEFQDVSPQLVRWLQQLQQALAQAGHEVSLMAIGDDWQSIYGWRGSSPELFMQFSNFFSATRSDLLFLQENYRSTPVLVADAERVLQQVQCKQAKHSQAMRQPLKADHGVRLRTGFDLSRDMDALIAELREQCQVMAKGPTPERTAVLVLARRNEVLKQINAALPAGLPVKAMSIHRAKGLQADVAMIIDDCVAPQAHPFRCALYARCGVFSNSYDQAMQDENLRLAYVAITRGVRRVLWFSRQRQGALLALPESA